MGLAWAQNKDGYGLSNILTWRGLIDASFGILTGYKFCKQTAWLNIFLDFFEYGFLSASEFGDICCLPV